MKEKILLTGATGFLGSHILKRLIEIGENVVILVREKSNKERINNLQGFSIFKINQDFSNIEELYKTHKITTIIHLATEYGRKNAYSTVIKSNVLFPIRLIELADKKNLKLFINTDSFSSKFPDSTYLKEYVSSKIFFKEYLKSLSDLQVFNLQLEHIFGEYDSHGKFVTFLFESMLGNQKSIKLTKGTQMRDFIYVSDVVDAYIIVLKSKNNLENYNEFEVGTGNSITVKEFVSKIHSIIGSKSNLLFGALQTRFDEIQDSKAKNFNLIALGWKPKVSIDQAIKKILNSMLGPQ